MKQLLLSAIACCLFSANIFSQTIVDEGYFNNWDYGPTSIHGNLRLASTARKTYYEIKKTAPGIVTIKHINPSGIAFSIYTVTFINGLLSRWEEANQWGDLLEWRIFKEIEKNVFQVTDYSKGVNVFLPCKYSQYVYKNELLTEIRYFSANGNLMENANGIAIVRYKKYDDSTRFAMIHEVSYFGAKGEPVKSKFTDFHKAVYEINELNERISETYFGTDGQPTTTRRSDVAEIHNSYDSDGNNIKIEFLGLAHQLVANLNGVAMSTLEFENGYDIKTTRYDAQRQPVKAAASGDGLAVIKSVYDSSGNRKNESYYDEHEAPINDHTGVHEISYRYNAGNMLTRVSYYNLRGKPALNRDKVHVIYYSRDSLGRISEKYLLGLLLEPVKDFVNQAYMIRYAYDQMGRDSLTSYWQDSTTKMPRWSGAYAEADRYNEDGQLSEYQFLDAENHPLIGSDGASTVRLSYNDDSRVKERLFLADDASGAKSVNRTRGVTSGYALIRYNYNITGQVSEIEFFDTEGNPVNAQIDFDNIFLAHKIEFTYRSFRPIEQKYYLIGKKDAVRTVDCLTNDFIAPNGISTGRKNQ
ncbi:MAG TPA: hypothetical protein VKT28_13905 [Puia sp.]|nr:hypothetical protein [Puia sp.]